MNPSDPDADFLQRGECLDDERLTRLIGSIRASQAIQKSHAEAVEQRLRLHFAEADVLGATLWLTEPELAFHQLGLPVCFACERCPWAPRCGFLGAAHINATVKARHEERPVGSGELARLFDALPGPDVIPGATPAD